MFNQRVGRALHRPGPAERAQHARAPASSCPRRGRRDSVTTMPPASAARERAPARFGRGGVGQVPAGRSRAHAVRRDASAEHGATLRYASRMSSHRHRLAPTVARRLGGARRRHPRAGAASSASRRSASPTPISRPRKRGCSTGSPRAGTARWIIWHATASRRARPAELVPGHAARDHRAHELPAPAARAARARCSPTARTRVRRALRARPRLPQGAARAAAAARRAHRATRSATSAIACSPTARRCWKWRWPPRPGSAGAASTRCC